MHVIMPFWTLLKIVISGALMVAFLVLVAVGGSAPEPGMTCPTGTAHRGAAAGP
jgi:hypothetical protein